MHSQHQPTHPGSSPAPAPAILTGVILALSLAQPGIGSEQDAPSACLWRVQSSNTTAYIQGSVHLLSDDAYPLPSQVEMAFKASERIVLEMDLAIMTDPEAQLELVIKGMLPEGKTLHDVLSPQTLELAEDCAQDIGLSMVAFKRYKPWMFVMALTSTRLQQLGFSAENGLDWHFYKRAKELEKAIVGLETLDEQLALFESVVEEDQDAFVRQSLEDFATLETDIAGIMEAWTHGDLDALSEALFQNLREYPNIQRILIDDRNAKWMRTLNGMMQSGVTTMVIVGAGHLPGEGGLIAQLRASGYTVEQL
ncbi:MAG: TraB/GumN family protein [Verrucomicrobia bacterium]|jgi:uncharacterized protein|nr:TraB/GumN family protein [Verrucomicrobiota bacterium]